MHSRKGSRWGRQRLTRALKIENSKWSIFPLDGIKTKSTPGVHYDMHRCTCTVICAVSLQNAFALASHMDSRPLGMYRMQNHPIAHPFFYFHFVLPHFIYSFVTEIHSFINTILLFPFPYQSIFNFLFSKLNLHLEILV